MRNCHSSQVTEAQLPLLTRMCERPSLSDTVKCPLCATEENDMNGFVRRGNSIAKPVMDIVTPYVSEREEEHSSRSFGYNEEFKEQGLDTAASWVIHLPEE